MKWQPIESAPKDGTEIILAIPSGIRKNYWVQLGWYDSDQSFFKWQFYDGVADDMDDRAMVNGVDEDGPLFWMPLPPPPQGDE